LSPKIASRETLATRRVRRVLCNRGRSLTSSITVNRQQLTRGRATALCQVSGVPGCSAFCTSRNHEKHRRQHSDLRASLHAFNHRPTRLRIDVERTNRRGLLISTSTFAFVLSADVRWCPVGLYMHAEPNWFRKELCLLESSISCASTACKGSLLWRRLICPNANLCQDFSRLYSLCRGPHGFQVLSP
jgi:hypothetical protein